MYVVVMFRFSFIASSFCAGDAAIAAVAAIVFSLIFVKSSKL